MRIIWFCKMRLYKQPQSLPGEHSASDPDQIGGFLPKEMMGGSVDDQKCSGSLKETIASGNIDPSGNQRHHKENKRDNFEDNSRQGAFSGRIGPHRMPFLPNQIKNQSDDRNEEPEDGG